MARSLIAIAYAKINLTLEVLGKRADGYHEVRTVLQTIDLSDTLEVEKADGLDVRCDVPGLTGEANLVWKAMNALRSSAGYGGGARVWLSKRIPLDMGLGGGSSDAAAALMALNSLWGTGLPIATLAAIARSLGSDVPFFLRGGTALARGRGEDITSLSPLPLKWLVLVCPETPELSAGGTHPSKTARLYSMLSASHYTDGTLTDRVADSLMRGDFAEGDMFNVFEAVAPRAFPSLDNTVSRVLEVGLSRVHMSGSGPALFAFVPGEERARSMARLLQSQGLRSYAVATTQGRYDTPLQPTP